MDTEKRKALEERRRQLQLKQQVYLSYLRYAPIVAIPLADLIRHESDELFNGRTQREFFGP